jgi:hypothetical protein
VGAKDEAIVFFKDAQGTYGIPRPGRRLPESEKLRREIEALTVSLWTDPGDRAETEAMLEPLRARLRYLEQHPDMDKPP